MRKIANYVVFLCAPWVLFNMVPRSGRLLLLARVYESCRFSESGELLFMPSASGLRAFPPLLCFRVLLMFSFSPFFPLFFLFFLFFPPFFPFFSLYFFFLFFLELRCSHHGHLSIPPVPGGLVVSGPRAY